MTVETLSNSLTAVAEFFEEVEFRDGAALRPATVTEMARMFRNMAARAVMLERAASIQAAPGTAWGAIAAAVQAPDGNVALFPVAKRPTPPRDPQPAA